jgi:hypothetical protein
MSEVEIIDASAGTEVEVRGAEPPAPANLFRTEDPNEIVRRATETATALSAVLKAQKLTSNISGREHVRVEGWSLLGTMLGVFPVCVWTRKVVGDTEGDTGWEARVEARTLSGAIVGAAEAECLRSERTWSKRDDYALRSMAQTRATSKALRQPLGFVVTLAGFDPTPAEEMPSTAGGIRDERPKPPDAVIKGPEPLSRPTSWGKVTECVSAYDEKTYETFMLFASAARRLLYPGATDTKSLSKEEKAELLRIAGGAALALRNAVDPATFPPPSVDDIRAAWASVLEGQELAIPQDEAE